LRAHALSWVCGYVRACAYVSVSVCGCVGVDEGVGVGVGVSFVGACLPWSRG